MDFDSDSIRLVSDEPIKVAAARQGVTHANWAFIFALAFISAWSMISGVVLLASFFCGMDPPAWAIAVQSSTITGAVALIFRDHIPSTTRESD